MLASLDAVLRPGARGVRGTDGGEQCGDGVGFADGDQVGVAEVLVLVVMPRRRAAPTRAIAASRLGQTTWRAGER